MNHRSLPLSRLVIAGLVALSLALGTVASADAADLTKKAVRKIATKVVKKQAKTLTVARAKTADTATTVGGLTGAQLRTTGYRYALPSQATVYNRIYHFPGLPDGAYLVSYNFTATMSASGAQVGCMLVTAAGNVAVSFSQYQSTFTRASATDSAVVDADTTLDCGSSGGTYSIDSGMVTFIPIDTVVTGNTVGNTV